MFCHCFSQGWSSRTNSPRECWLSQYLLLQQAAPLCAIDWFRNPDDLPVDVDAWTSGHALSWALVSGDTMIADSSADRFFQIFKTG